MYGIVEKERERSEECRVFEKNPKSWLAYLLVLSVEGASPPIPLVHALASTV